MKAAVYHGEGDVRIEDLPVPEPAAGELLLRVHSCGLCGTDVSKYVHRLVEPPAILGHEIAGVVERVGEGVERFKPGDRAIVPHHIPCFVCRYCRHENYSMCRSWKPTRIEPGGFCEYVNVAAESVKSGMRLIPADLDFDVAAMAESVACCLRAYRRTPLQPGDLMAVLGCGPVGLTHVMLGEILGAGGIIALDIEPCRLEAARRLGADAALDASDDDLGDSLHQMTGGGVDLAMVCVGRAEAIYSAIDIVRDGGVVNCFAECPPGSELTIDPNILYRREVVMAGSYSSSPIEIAMALRLLDSGRLPMDELITHRLPLEETPRAFELAVEGKEALKIVINP